MGIVSCRPPVPRPPLSSDPAKRELQLRERAIAALRSLPPPTRDTSSGVGGWMMPFLFGWMMGHD